MERQIQIASAEAPKIINRGVVETLNLECYFGFQVIGGTVFLPAVLECQTKDEDETRRKKEEEERRRLDKIRSGQQELPLRSKGNIRPNDQL